jgi:DedD protein
MASGGRRGGSERVLESRHLVGLFLGVVLLCAVFFTLGYVMGKTQYGGATPLSNAPAADHPDPSPALSHEASHLAPKAADDPADNREWDFYSSDKKQEPLETPDSSTASANSAKTNSADQSAVTQPSQQSAPTRARNVSATSDMPRRGKAPWIPKGAIVLQLAALRREGDALAMADALQQKGFPSFVVTPTNDNFYRVQVGPYRDATSAEKAKQSLDRAGFKAIVKR